MTQLDMAAARVMAEGWWTYLVRGVIAVAFGVLAFISPLWGLTLLVALFGIWALMEGITSFLTGIRSRATQRNWWVEILEAIVSIAAGVVAIVFPALTAEILLILIAAWAVVIGAFQVYLAIRIRDQIKGEFWLALAGAAAIVFGVAIFLFPAASALSVTWLIGSFAIAFGLLLIILGWRLRHIAELVRRDEATEYPAAG